MTKDTKIVEVTMTLTKETAGTYVYAEDLGEAGTPPKLKTQYVQKWALGNSPPKHIRVVVERVD